MREEEKEKKKFSQHHNVKRLSRPRRPKLANLMFVWLNHDDSYLGRVLAVNYFIRFIPSLS
jgi:hypothetical protein